MDNLKVTENNATAYSVSVLFFNYGQPYLFELEPSLEQAPILKKYPS